MAGEELLRSPRIAADDLGSFGSARMGGQADEVPDPGRARADSDAEQRKQALEFSIARGICRATAPVRLESAVGFPDSLRGRVARMLQDVLPLA